MCLKDQTERKSIIISSSNSSRNKIPSEEAIQRIAKILENHLFTSAPTFKIYCDTSTLNSRVLDVLRKWRSRRQGRVARRNSVIKKRRSQILVEKLGRDTYSHAAWLVSEITIKKTSLIGENCPKCRLANPKMDSTSPFSERLPIPVRNLFFNTPLPEIFEKYSLERVQSYGPYYLNEVIQQAEAHLQEYVTWKDENTICQL